MKQLKRKLKNWKRVSKMRENEASDYDKEKVNKIIKLNEFVFKLKNEYEKYLKENEINYNTFY